MKLHTICTICILFLSAVLARAQSAAEYIDEHAAFARELMHNYKIPASLILAVAIHESASGNSRIAQYLNNHFGVKGPNNAEIHSSYRSYLNADESYSHFVEIMETRSPFNNLFEKYDQYDYKGWARGIQRSGYAHSINWANQVIALVKKYKLYQYDERPEGYTEPVSAITSHRRKGKSSGIYIVKPGDNLNVIAKRKGTTAKAIMQKNGMKWTGLKPGQKVKL